MVDVPLSISLAWPSAALVMSCFWISSFHSAGTIGGWLLSGRVHDGQWWVVEERTADEVDCCCDGGGDEDYD